MIDVEVTNFQSIEKAAFKVQGFTALSGRSNIGKSALVRAIKCALTNARGTYFVRHSDTCLRRVRGLKTCKCMSTVRIRAEGFDLLWEKGDSINRTTINGVEYDKPEGIEFLKDFGLAPVPIGQRSAFLQVSDQFDQPFLLDESGNAIAELVADVGQLAVINEAMRMADKDRKEASSLRKVREKDVADLGVKIAAYEGLDDSATIATAAEKLLSDCSARETTFRRLSNFIERVAKLGSATQMLAGIEKIEIPDIAGIETSLPKLTQLARFISSLNVKVPAFKALEGIDKIGVPDVSTLQDDGTKVVALNRWVAQLRTFKERLSTLEAVANVTVPEAEALTDTGNSLQRLGAWVGRVDSLEKTILRVESELERASEEETVVMGEVDALGVCPTCIRPVTKAHTHETERV